MIETFNARVRDECLNQHWFESLNEAKEPLKEWWKEYNQERPHSSLNNLTPEQYLASWQTGKQIKKGKS
jgi:putative transposase